MDTAQSQVGVCVCVCVSGGMLSRMWGNTLAINGSLMCFHIHGQYCEHSGFYLLGGGEDSPPNTPP